MKKIFKMIAIILATICSFGLFARITTNAHLFESKKKADTEQEHEIEEPQTATIEVGRYYKMKTATLTGYNYPFEEDSVFTYHPLIGVGDLAFYDSNGRVDTMWGMGNDFYVYWLFSHQFMSDLYMTNSYDPCMNFETGQLNWKNYDHATFSELVSSKGESNFTTDGVFSYATSDRLSVIDHAEKVSFKVALISEECPQSFIDWFVQNFELI